MRDCKQLWKIMRIVKIVECRERQLGIVEDLTICARSCKFAQDRARSGKIVQDRARFCKIVQDRRKSYRRTVRDVA